MARHRAGLGMRHLALAVAAGLFAVACGGSIPPEGPGAILTTPSSLTPAAEAVVTSDVSRTRAKDVVTFSLINGRFKVTSGRGELAGTYLGLVTASTRDRSTVAMTLQVTEGSRDLAGATGTLAGDGSGAFLTGGHFVLTLTGDIRTSAEPQGSRVQTTVVGMALLPLTCSASNHLISQLRGEGLLQPAGRSVMEFDSEILETNCF